VAATNFGLFRLRSTQVAQCIVVHAAPSPPYAVKDFCVNLRDQRELIKAKAKTQAKVKSKQDFLAAILSSF
jgi:hypothetical protein